MAHLKLAVRNLAKTPFITAVAVLSLALGIGANAAIFSLFDQVLLRPLPVQEPERLVNLSNPGPKPGSQSCNQAGDCDHVFSYAMFRDLQRADVGFSAVAAHRMLGVNLATGDRTLSGSGVLVSGSYFPALGLQPQVGRLLTPDDDGAPGQHPVAVLNDRFWTRELGADPEVVGDTLVVNGQTLTVVGVAPRGFDGTTTGSDPDVFVPISMRAALESYFAEEDFDDRQVYWVYSFGRLAPGVSREQASAGANRIYSTVINEVEAPLQEGMSDQTMEQFRAKKLVLEPGAHGQSPMRKDAWTPLVLLFAITGVVLLIACANIANLLLARGAARIQEMAIRSSLGAGRGRLLVQLLTESAVLAVAGGAGQPAGRSLDPGADRLAAPGRRDLDPAPRAQPGGRAVRRCTGPLTGLLFGMYPALHSTRPDLVTSLKSGGGQPSAARSAARFRSALVTAQIALSMALLLAAGLFIKSLINVSRVELGLDEDNLVTFSISPALNGYEPPRAWRCSSAWRTSWRRSPGVLSVSDALVPILSGNNWGSSVNVEGFERGPDTDANARFNKVGAGYFKTLGVALLAGRELTPSDVDGGLKVAIVNEAFAEKFHLGGRGGGGQVDVYRRDEGGARHPDRRPGPERQVLRGQGRGSGALFRPYRQELELGFLTFYVRTRIAPEQVMQAIPTVIKRLDPNLPVEELKTLDRQIEENVFLDRLITTLAASFAVLATLLAAIGLYGVLAYSVAQRTREIGVRMALGAGSGRVRRMVLRQLGGMLLVGGVIGMAAAVAAGHAARSLLFGLEGTDPVVLAAGSVLLVAVALTAGYVPARRASQVDPMDALRSE